jgi:cholestenol Delta-isomerase
MAPTPYFPQGLQLDGYKPQVLDIEVILFSFFSATVIVGGLSWAFAIELPAQERGLFTWLVITGLIHLIVEGAFSLNSTFYQNDDPRMFLLELWKEYSKADSRYATRDAFTTTMETCTAFFVGPCCLAAATGIMTKAAWRWPLIIILSIMQLYGDVLYFATYWFDGSKFTRPEPFYFYLYFVFMNSIWIVIPLWCLQYATQQCMHGTRLADGSAKKSV